MSAWIAIKVDNNEVISDGVEESTYLGPILKFLSKSKN